MKKHLFLFICLIMAGTLSGQVKSIAVINDVEDQLYLIKRGFVPHFEVTQYSCSFGQSQFAGQEMVRLLGTEYQVELIEIPAKFRKSRGLLKGSSRSWFRELNDKYDLVIYVYTCTKKNKRLFGTNYPLYSSGLINEHFNNARNSMVYSSVTARVFTTKTGTPFYHLDNRTFNATRQPLKKLTFVEDINNEEVCKDVSLILQGLISARLEEFVKGLEVKIGQ